MVMIDLTLVWAAVIIVGMILYVILDGFDLGVGILFPFAEESDRSRMMASIAPVWDGNETWLVLGGGAIFAAFPIAYATLLPALYIPIILFLFALIFRGVSFEFRAKATRSRRAWSWAFALGSTVAAFGQGMVLGSFIQGFQVEGMRYTGGPFDWLTPFSLFTGLALVLGYGLLGATWLVIKTDGHLQTWCYKAAEWLLAGVLIALAGVSLWTPFLSEDIAARWFSWPNLAWLLPVPLVTLAVALMLVRALRNRRERSPFWWAVGLFLLSFLGLAVSLWPYIVPRQITLHQAAASANAQGFLLVGVLILLPIILAYTVYVYRVFRGKVTEDGGY